MDDVNTNPEIRYNTELGRRLLWAGGATAIRKLLQLALAEMAH